MMKTLPLLILLLTAGQVHAGGSEISDDDLRAMATGRPPYEINNHDLRELSRGNTYAIENEDMRRFSRGDTWQINDPDLRHVAEGKDYLIKNDDVRRAAPAMRAARRK